MPNQLEIFQNLTHYIFPIFPILETEQNRDVAQGLGGGNISKIVPRRPLYFCKKGSTQYSCIGQTLQPRTSKIFERLLFDERYNFCNENDLLSSNQLGFRPGDSCINQLLSVTHKIEQSFDNDLELREECF